MSWWLDRDIKIDILLEVLQTSCIRSGREQNRIGVTAIPKNVRVRLQGRLTLGTAPESGIPLLEQNPESGIEGGSSAWEALDSLMAIVL